MPDNDPIIRLIPGDDGPAVELPRSAAEACILVNNALSLDDEDEPASSYDDVRVERVGEKPLQSIVKFLIHFRDEEMIAIADPFSGAAGDLMPEVVLRTFEENVPQEWYRTFADSIGEDLEHFYAVRSAANFVDIKPVSVLNEEQS